MKGSLVILSLAIWIPSMASAAGVGACIGDGCTYHTIINLTGLTDVTALGATEDTTNMWSYEIDSLGPVETNAQENSLLGAFSTGSPIAGWTPGRPSDGAPASFSADLGNNEPTIDIFFEDVTGDANDGLWVDFHIEEPNSFWLNPGVVTIPTGDVTYSINGGDPTTCNTAGVCTVGITSAATAPEPATLPLMGLVGIAALGFSLRKKATRTN